MRQVLIKGRRPHRRRLRLWHGVRVVGVCIRGVACGGRGAPLFAALCLAENAIGPAAYRPDDTLLVDRVLDLGDTVVFEAGAESQNHFVQTAVTVHVHQGRRCHQPPRRDNHTQK